MVNFALAFVLSKLTLASFAEQATYLGSTMLLCSFFLLVVPILAKSLQLMVNSVGDYFSASRRLERKLLFYTSKRNRVHRLFYFKKARLLYLNQQQRKILLKKADRNSVSP